MKGCNKLISFRFAPIVLEIILAVTPHLSMHESYIPSAITIYSPLTSIKTYSSSGFMHTATFDGIVQGVVVQIIKEIGFSSFGSNALITDGRLDFSTLKATSIDFEILS